MQYTSENFHALHIYLPNWDSVNAAFKSSISFRKTPGLFSLGLGQGLGGVTDLLVIDFIWIDSSFNTLNWFFRTSTWFGILASLLKFSLNSEICCCTRFKWLCKFPRTWERLGSGFCCRWDESWCLSSIYRGKANKYLIGVILESVHTSCF